MGVSYLRSKRLLVVKFLSRRHVPFGSFRKGLTLHTRNSVNSVHCFNYINSHCIGDKISYCQEEKTSDVLSLESRNQESLLTWDNVVLATMGIAMFVRLEKVPFIERYHLVFSCEPAERFFGYLAVKQLIGDREPLPQEDKESVRVQRVLENIVGALNASLRLQEKSSVLFKDKLSLNPEYENMDKNLPTVNDMKDYSRKRRKGKIGIEHLEGLKWKVMVVDSPICNARSASRGNIVVYTGILQKLESDEELAAILAHEVAHGVAQHSTAHLTNILWAIFLLLFDPGDNVNILMQPLLSYISRRRECEADYIGLMLMALAGYDPRVAPVVYEEKLPQINFRGFVKLLNTHPTGKKRAKKLRKLKVMDKAVAIYEEVKLGHGVRSFV